MIKSKKQMFIVIAVFTLVMLLGTVTYAFFNYTRTGTANRISVGDIYFTSSYDEVALDGVFPIAKSTINSDTDNVMSVDVDIEGHTSYANGLYYEVKAEDVNLTVNGKNIPIGISVSSNNLDNVTLTNYEDGKVLTNGSLFANGRILATTGATDNSVDGTITIKAYLDKDRIAISDTYNGLQTDLMGTTTGWVGGRVVLTTSEWNSLTSAPISFKVKVEAYENDVSTLVNGLAFNAKIKKLSGSITPEFEEYINQNVEELVNQHSQEEIDEILQQFGLSSIDDYRYAMGVESPDSNITTFERVTEEPNISSFTEDNIISTPDSVYPIYAWYDNGIIKYYSKTNNIKANTNMDSMFIILQNLTSIGDLSSLDTTNVTSMVLLFGFDSSLIDVSFLSNWNTSNVTNMNKIFQECANLVNINELSNWSTLNVTNMSFMFYKCASLTNISGLSTWNVSNVNDVTNMFVECTGLTSLDGLSTWNVSSVRNATRMFDGCTGLTNLDGLSTWNVSNVSNMNSMFNRCIGLINLDSLSAWDVSNVTIMAMMFDGCTGLTNLDGLSTWDVSNVTNMGTMFTGCSGITTLTSLSSWNVSNVTNMGAMFMACTSLSDASGINDWDISSVTMFNKMFNGVSTHPEFTKRAGTWNNGTFTPTA